MVINLKSNKGFTLIELLAAIVILGVIATIAVPNIMGALNKSKASQYVNDAKKLVSLAEKKIRANPDIAPSSNGKCSVLTLNYLDDGSFENTPNGGAYNNNYSYVLIQNKNNSYIYYASLVETKGSSSKGVKKTTITNINNAKDPINLVSTSGFSDYRSGRCDIVK